MKEGGSMKTIALIILVVTLWPQLILLGASFGLIKILLVVWDLSGVLGVLIVYVAITVLGAYSISRGVER